MEKPPQAKESWKDNMRNKRVPRRYGVKNTLFVRGNIFNLLILQLKIKKGLWGQNGQMATVQARESRSGKDLIFVDFFVEGLAVNPQDFGGLTLIPSSFF